MSAEVDEMRTSWTVSGPVIWQTQRANPKRFYTITRYQIGEPRTNKSHDIFVPMDCECTPHRIKKSVPVPVAPELLPQVRLMTLLVAKRRLALDPVHNVPVHSCQTENSSQCARPQLTQRTVHNVPVDSTAVTKNRSQCCHKIVL